MVLEYAESHGGNCNVPKSYIASASDTNASDIKLGAWVSYQRTLRNKRKLHSDREILLQLLVDAGKLTWNTKEEKDKEGKEQAIKIEKEVVLMTEMTSLNTTEELVLEKLPDKESESVSALPSFTDEIKKGEEMCKQVAEL